MSGTQNRRSGQFVETSADVGGPLRGAAKKRKFCTIRGRTASRASGFEVLNGQALFLTGPRTFLPPLGRRGFRDYPERPVFMADARIGRLHRDFEEYSGYWFVSVKMKRVLQDIDPEAFEFLECEVRSAEGERQPPRFLCDVTRILDAVDEPRSTVQAATASDGSRYYRLLSDSILAFKEEVVGRSHVFRMKYFEAAVVCDDEFRQACRSAELKGISFDDRSR
ncbi:imm11 family protein [Bradyrhizobium sp. HKCCYLS2038]|uniref:imm11 family protein n=1 Tax=Bradyrhizobium sp. HKCCYLS2038 TaxID=3420764 RepID=UPI003EB9E7A8